LNSCHEIFDGAGRDCIDILLQVSPQEKNLSDLDPAKEEAMQSPSTSNPTSGICRLKPLLEVFPIVRWGSFVLMPQSLHHSWSQMFKQTR
jgi:hypothetical protein